jgi:hypothetical protein
MSNPACNTEARPVDGCHYSVVRMYFRGGKRVLIRNLTLAEVQAHCSDPETSSSTCTKYAGRRRTEQLGPWFDGYEHDQ